MVETALRETREEIDLATADIEVLGVLGDYYTQAGYRITPVVGLIQPPYRVLANPQEVAAIYEVSLARALDSANYALTWPRNSNVALGERVVASRRSVPSQRVVRAVQRPRQ